MAEESAETSGAGEQAKNLSESTPKHGKCAAKEAVWLLQTVIVLTHSLDSIGCFKLTLCCIGEWCWEWGRGLNWGERFYE